MNRVLIAFAEIPEEYFFIDLTVRDQDFDLLRSFHGHFINEARDSDELQKKMINFFYNDKTGIFKFPQIKESLRSEKFDLFIICGFIL